MDRSAHGQNEPMLLTVSRAVEKNLAKKNSGNQLRRAASNRQYGCSRLVCHDDRPNDSNFRNSARL